MDQRLSRLIKYSAIVTILFMIACGLVMVIWEVHPFFLDEWAIIYNLKYKTFREIWGQLDKTQQFPRIYLYLIKLFNDNSVVNFSYQGLRLPSFLVHSLGIWYCVYLSGRLFKDQPFYRWLWVLIYVAYPSSVFYFVLTKQYTMEMFLALVGIAQLALLLNISGGKEVSKGKYLLLCLSFLLAPSFSYTYPMVVAPVYLLVLLNTLQHKQRPLKAWIPLFLGVLGIFILYLHDIRQVMSDKGMANYWKDYYMSSGFSLSELCYHIYMYFYNFGRGPFMMFLAFVGISSWLYCSYRSISLFRQKEKTLMEWLVLYSVLLMWLSVLLFVARMLPLNAHRLNAYKTPATGIMIIWTFIQVIRSSAFVRPAQVIAGILFLLQIVFVVQPLIRNFVEDDHKRKMLIYNNGKTAIATAQQNNIPLFTTSMTLYPHDDIDQADWVIKSYPAYKRAQNIPVYPVEFDYEADSILYMLPYTSGVVTVGDSVFIIEK